MKSKNVLKILNVTRQTLTSYVKSGKIKVEKLPNGTYEYSDDDIYRLVGLNTPRETAIYARVSTQKQKNDLQNQINTIKAYVNSKGISPTKIYSDISSGLGYDRCEFQKMLNDIISHKIKCVYILDKDRLTRISYDMWKNLFSNFNCELHTINECDNVNENDEKEIFADIISLLHCFAMRMYSSRRKKKMTLIKEDLENEIGL